MLKNATNQEKFAILSHWVPRIIEDLKRDFRQDHLRKDLQFLKLHFGSKPVNKITLEELVRAYLPFLRDGNEEIWDFLSNRWLLKHAEVYSTFEKLLGAISADFTELDVLSKGDAKKVLEAAVEEYGAIDTLIFSVINSVVFPRESYDQLIQEALAQEKQEAEEEEEEKQFASVEEVKEIYEREFVRLADRCEKKILGMQSKYDRDVTALKKQIAALQRKAHESVSVSN